MTLAFVGGTHRTVPLRCRERLAFSAEQAADALCRFRDRFPGREVVLLSTCNRRRTLRGRRGGRRAAAGRAARVVSRRVPRDRCGRAGTRARPRERRGGRAAPVQRRLGPRQHGARRAADRGPGEAGLALAQRTETAGPLTGGMFQAALRTAKRVASETALGRERLSIPSVAVADFARGVFERFDDKRVLVIGGWQDGDETLRYLARPEPATSSWSIARPTVPIGSRPGWAGGRAGSMSSWRSSPRPISW